MNSGNVCYKKTLRLSSEELVCGDSTGKFFGVVSVSAEKMLTGWMDLLTDGPAAEGGSERRCVQRHHPVSGHLPLPRNDLSVELG